MRAMWFAGLAGLAACAGKDPETHTGTETDTDTDTDTDADADSDADADADADTDVEPVAVTLSFDARFGDEPIRCGQVYDATPYGSSTLELGDFRLYLSEIALLDGAGAEVPLTLTDDGVWQGGGVALLDFEDGSGLCGDSGNAGSNAAVVGTVPAGEYTGLSFTVGVPFDQNHQDVAFAPAPLNVPAMFWIWQYGYKFVRIDMFTDQVAPANFWVLHLGSDGCESAGYTEAPTVECDRPNRPRVILDGFDAANDTVVIDLAALLTGADIGSDTPYTAPGCMSADDVECPPLFTNLGLDYATGGCADGCAGQTVFRVE